MPTASQPTIPLRRRCAGATPTAVLSTLLVLASAFAAGCGSDEPTPKAAAAQAEPVAAAAAERPEAPPSEPAPDPPEESTPAATPQEPTQPARDELARRERELADREARLDRRETALEDRVEALEQSLPQSAPAPAEPGVGDAEPAAELDPEPSPEPVPTPADDPRVLPDAEDDPLATEDDDWRLSRHRKDRAAREGLGLEPMEVEAESPEIDAEPLPESAPEAWDSRILPSGTRMTVELTERVASDTGRAGDLFRSVVAEDVLRGGEVVIPAGSTVLGRIVEAVPLDKRIGGRARLDLEFHLLEIAGAPDPDGVAIQADFAVKGRSETARDAATIGGAAVGGAILGRVLDRDDDRASAIGAIIGAAAGTVAAARSEGEEVELPAGARIELVLTRPAEVPVRRAI